MKEERLGLESGGPKICRIRGSERTGEVVGVYQGKE
jgi:hypothetical protein